MFTQIEFQSLITVNVWESCMKNVRVKWIIFYLSFLCKCWVCWRSVDVLTCWRLVVARWRSLTCWRSDDSDRCDVGITLSDVLTEVANRSLKKSVAVQKVELLRVLTHFLTALCGRALAGSSFIIVTVFWWSEVSPDYRTLSLLKDGNEERHFVMILTHFVVC